MLIPKNKIYPFMWHKFKFHIHFRILTSIYQSLYLSQKDAQAHKITRLYTTSL